MSETADQYYLSIGIKILIKILVNRMQGYLKNTVI